MRRKSKTLLQKRASGPRRRLRLRQFMADERIQFMKKAVICVLALLVAGSVSACGALETIVENMQKQQETKQPETQEQTIMEDTEIGKILIDEVGDIMVGPESETELEAIVVDDTEAGSERISETVPETEPAAPLPGMSTEPETEKMQSKGPMEAVISEQIAGREAMGEHWSVAYEDLETGEQYGYQEEDVMQSASVVKLFIMGAVYRYMCYPPEGEEVIPFHEEYEGQLRDTIVSMITVSDNGCANLLIERLGEGDFSAGAQRIRAFCEENGYPGTSIGRRFLEENPSGDNFTTAADTRKFLSDLYHGKLVSEEASAKMLEIVKGQTRKNKIPAGLPAGFTSGNKTGEMPEGYGLGCIENDSAIVFPPEGMGEGYILTVMSNDLAGRNDQAIGVIGQISSMVAQWYQEQKGA